MDVVAERKAAGEPPSSDTHVLGYFKLLIDGVLCVQDLRLVQTRDGRQIVCMPSRHVYDHCPACGQKNSVRAHYCNQCGRPLDGNRASPMTGNGKPLLYRDVVFPINAAARTQIERAVFAAHSPATEGPNHG